MCHDLTCRYAAVTRLNLIAACHIDLSKLHAFCLAVEQGHENFPCVRGRHAMHPWWLHWLLGLLTNGLHAAVVHDQRRGSTSLAELCAWVLV